MDAKRLRLDERADSPVTRSASASSTASAAAAAMPSESGMGPSKAALLSGTPLRGTAAAMTAPLLSMSRTGSAPLFSTQTAIGGMVQSLCAAPKKSRTAHGLCDVLSGTSAGLFPKDTTVSKTKAESKAADVTEWLSRLSPFGTLRCVGAKAVDVSRAVWRSLCQVVDDGALDVTRVKRADTGGALVGDYGSFRQKKDCDFLSVCFEVFEGRYFGKSLSMAGSEFQISIIEDAANGNTLVEVRRTGGDSMLHSDVFDTVRNGLLKAKINCAPLFAGLGADDSMSSGCMSPGQVSDSSGATIDDMPCFGFGVDFDMSAFELSDGDIEMSGAMGLGSGILADAQVSEWFETVCNPRAFHEVWLDAALQLAAEVTFDSTKAGALRVLSSKERVLAQLMTAVSGPSPVCDAYVCRAVLVVVNALLQSEALPMTASLAAESRSQVEKIKVFWTAPSRSCDGLDLKFVPSQQVLEECKKAKVLLAAF